MVPALIVLTAILNEAPPDTARASEKANPVYRAIEAGGLFVAPQGEEVPPSPRAYPNPVEPAGKVRCAYVDGVDCAKQDHGFTDDGSSRLWEYGGATWRVTAAGLKLSCFSYTLATRPRPGRPHLLVAELLNDRERYTTLTVTAPAGFRWAPPYTGEEGFHPQNQEDDGVRQDVGCAVYSGREFPVDGKPFLHAFLFWPKSDRVIVTVSHRGNEETRPDPFNGACVRRLWVYDVIDPLPPLSAGNERKIGLYVPHPWYLYGHYGIPARTREGRRKSIETFVRYLRFLGCNTVQFHVIDGSDTATRAWYRGSEHYPPLCGDLLEDLLPLCEKEGIEAVPIIAPLILPQVRKLSSEGDLCAQHDRDGKGFARGLRSGSPDPLRPETKQLLLACLREVAERCAPYRCVSAIGFRVNGKIGLCYVGDTLKERAQWRGYSPWNLAEFKKETGIDVPQTPREGYAFLEKNEIAWEAWLSWRCRRTASLYRAARDCLRSIRSDLTLLLACDLPSEVAAMNVEWGCGVPARDLLRYHGYDPLLVAGIDGIWSSRAHMVNSDRFFGKWGPPHSTNAWAHKAFQYDPRVAACFVPRAYRTVELYHNYWEESPHPENEFGPHLRTANGAPLGPHFLEPVPYVLRVENAARLLFMGWQRASINGEVLFRRLARQWRSIPLGPIRPFHGWIECTRGGWRGTCHGGFVWARYYGKRLVVANETVEEVDAVLREFNGPAVRLTLAPWEVRVVR